MRLILIHAPERCRPCREQMHRIENVYKNRPDLKEKVNLELIHADDEARKAKAIGFDVVPTLVLMGENGVELFRADGRVSEYLYERLAEQSIKPEAEFDMSDFADTAPAADVVFYRTYSRRTESGNREIFGEAIHRVANDIANLGHLEADEEELVLEQALKQHTFPSGRWLWVGGTEWIKKPENFSGAYNCTSTNIDSPEAFGLLMDLAMMGSGTGAILEDSMVEKLPAIANKVDILDVSSVGKEPGRPDTFYDTSLPSGEVILVVGDSRKGWVDAYQALINWAMGIDCGQLAGTIRVSVDLSNVRPSGSKLNGFGGTANPVKLEQLFRKVAALLSSAQGRKLTPVECCLLIDEAAACIVAGNIRRSAGMRQFSFTNEEAANAKDGLYTQDEEGNWKVDPVRENLRMANHTRCAHTKPTLDEVKAAVTKQFWSGEGAIQYVPEAVARSNADLLSDADEKASFIELYEQGYGEEFLCSLMNSINPDMDPIAKKRELKHRMERFGLNPCGEILGADFHCNLAEVHLNTLDPNDLDQQDQAFKAAALQVAALLHHEFHHNRYQLSRQWDPIVGVSFTGLFDFFVHKWGADWLGWMMDGRPADSDYPELEAQYLSHWRHVVKYTIDEYCKKHGINAPNRTTTVQPAGTKSLLTGASSGWHPPKAQRFIRRITVGAKDPVALAAIKYGFSVIPAQSARDEEGNLLDDIYDKRSTEWLIEIPTEVSWANLPGCDKYDLSQLSARAQFGLYMNVQNHYTEHNTSATIEFREHEIDELSELIHDAMGNGYISAALLARFDANATFPRLPFEPISKETYDEMVERVAIKGERCPSFQYALQLNDSKDLELVAASGACTSAACIAAADKAEREGK